MYQPSYPPNANNKPRDTRPWLLNDTFATPEGPGNTLTVTVEELLKLTVFALIVDALFALTAIVTAVESNEFAVIVSSGIVALFLSIYYPCIGVIIISPSLALTVGVPPSPAVPLAP